MSIGRRNEPWAAIVDSLEFSNINESLKALLRNGFSPFAEASETWEGNPAPEGTLYDARKKEPRVYSQEGYWRS